MSTFEGLTLEEREQIKQQRDRGLRFLKKLCLLQVSLSVVSVIVGIIAVGAAVQLPDFPYTKGASIWSAVLVTIGAGCGFLATKHGYNKDTASPSVRVYAIAHYVFSVLSIIICTGIAILSVTGIFLCRKSRNCQPDETTLILTSGSAAVVGGFLAFSCVLGTCYLVRYGRTLGFKSEREYRMERRQRAAQMQLEILRTQYGSQAYSYPEGEGQVVEVDGFYTWVSDY